MINTCNNVAEHYENQDERNKFLEQIAQDGHINDFDVQLIRKNGSSFSSSITAQAVKDHNGNIIGLEGRILDISERKKRVKAELAKERAEAAERIAELASQAKSNFLANMSHELRTPLNAILGFAQIMERNVKDSSNKESLEIIQRSGSHLLALINQVLDLSKIEAGHIILEKNCFDLFYLLDDLENMLALKAAKKELKLSFEISQEVPQYICTDNVRLRQVLINLISNAIKFTKEGFVVLRITLQSRNDSDITLENENSHSSSGPDADCLIKFEIEDSGVGVGPTEIDQLFQAFGQTSSGINIGEGTGLGLVISKKFVELLGGEIYLESKVGQGSTFSFKIPVQEVSKNETTLALQIARVVGLEPGQPCYRLLIVDDKWDNRQLLVRMLDSYGFELREAESGQEALDIQEVWAPDLIWMDIRMPGIDGLEAAKLIRAQASHIKQPVIIAVTAGVLQTQLEALLREVCDDIIIKPFKENNLIEVLRKYLNIKYLYESIAKTGESLGLKTEKLRVSPSDFHALPKEIVLQLKESVAALRLSSALDTIEEIRKRDEPLANTLHELAIEFRFDTLQLLLNQSEQP